MAGGGISERGLQPTVHAVGDYISADPHIHDLIRGGSHSMVERSSFVYDATCFRLESAALQRYMDAHSVAISISLAASYIALHPSTEAFSLPCPHKQCLICACIVYNV